MQVGPLISQTIPVVEASPLYSLATSASGIYYTIAARVWLSSYSVKVYNYFSKRFIFELGCERKPLLCLNLYLRLRLQVNNDDESTHKYTAFTFKQGNSWKF